MDLAGSDLAGLDLDLPPLESPSTLSDRMEDVVYVDLDLPVDLGDAPLSHLATACHQLCITEHAGDKPLLPT